MSIGDIWLITGCSTGLGRALAEEGLERGATVVATARNPDTLADFVARHPNRAIALALDVTRPEQIASVVAEVEHRFGHIDLLVNNAAMVVNGAVEEMEDADYRPMFETNLFGPITLIRAALPGMRAQGRGHILNISSMASIKGVIGFGHYGAAKAGLLILSEALAEEVEPFGIGVTVIDLGGHVTKGSANMTLAAKSIPAYDVNVHARQAMIRANSGNEMGDARLAAKAIITAVSSETPPRHIPVGADSVERTYQKLELRRETLDVWRTLAESTRRVPQS